MEELAREVHGLFEPGGPLAREWPRFEDRPGQRALAVEIAATLERGGVLLAEAPTGIGKSLAYLLPCALYAARRERRVVIATCTRSLQDQLYERDLPGLLRAIGLRLPYVRLKGKQNYVCPRALDLVDPRGAEEHECLDRLRHWATHDSEGDLDRFEPPDAEAFRRMRGRVAADPDGCTAATCRRGRECFWVRARRQAAEAALVVVNHALLARAYEVEGLLPDHDVLVVDEAHRLEGVLIGQLERSVSRHRFEELMRLIGSGRGGRSGLLGRLRGWVQPGFADADAAAGVADELQRAARRIPECRNAVARLFETVAPSGPGHEVYGARERYRSALELLGPDLEPLEAVLGHCADFARTLRRLAGRIEGRGSAGEELAAELEQVGARWAALGADLERIADASEAGWVYWRGGRGVELHSAPVDVGAFARALVPGRARAAILTSATLSTGGDMTFMAERLGLGDEWGVPYATSIQPSPFPLERQMRAWVLEGEDGEAESVAALVEALSRETGRNQLVLFTAHERLRRARALLADRLPVGRVVLAQDWDGPAGLVAEQFRATRGAILLGVQALWEGVDFPGWALEILIVAKLPFSVPDDPIVEARGERLAGRGLDPFRHDAVPEAVLRFRQGVGRLIRRADDRGVLVVCDPRLARASYRRAFLEALPVAPRRATGVDEVARAAGRFLSGEVSVEEHA